VPAFGFSRTFRLSDTVAIRRALKKKPVCANGVNLFYARNGLGYNRYICTFRRNFSTAVKRNHIRRFCKELFRYINGRLCQGYDLVFLFSDGEIVLSYGLLWGLLQNAAMLPDKADFSGIPTYLQNCAENRLV
jgi:ribonuclease P protein component